MKILLAILIAATMSVSAQSQPTSPKPPAFQLAASAKRVLVEKAAALKLGDSYQSVTNRLGTPTHDQQLARKESSRVIGRSLTYYAVIWETGLVNEKHDQLVEVSLDERDRVQSVHIRVTIE